MFFIPYVSVLAHWYQFKHHQHHHLTASGCQLLITWHVMRSLVFALLYCMKIGVWVCTGNWHSRMNTCKIASLPLFVFKCCGATTPNKSPGAFLLSFGVDMSNLSNQCNTHSSSCKITGILYRNRPYKHTELFNTVRSSLSMSTGLMREGTGTADQHYMLKALRFTLPEIASACLTIFLHNIKC